MYISIAKTLCDIIDEKDSNPIDRVPKNALVEIIDHINKDLILIKYEGSIYYTKPQYIKEL